LICIQIKRQGSQKILLKNLFTKAALVNTFGFAIYYHQFPIIFGVVWSKERKKKTQTNNQQQQQKYNKIFTKHVLLPLLIVRFKKLIKVHQISVV